MDGVWRDNIPYSPYGAAWVSSGVTAKKKIKLAQVGCTFFDTKILKPYVRNSERKPSLIRDRRIQYSWGWVGVFGVTATHTDKPRLHYAFCGQWNLNNPRKFRFQFFYLFLEMTFKIWFNCTFSVKQPYQDSVQSHSTSHCRDRPL